MLQFNIGPDIPASTFNADETIHQGIEAGLSLQLADWLRLRQVYQYSDFRFSGDAQFGDNRLPVVPEHVYRAELRLGTDKAHVAPNIEWVPDGAWADYNNTLKTGGYALVGLTVGATVADGIDLFLDARNLLQEKAVGDISAVITATPASVIYYPVQRRAVFGGVRARFSRGQSMADTATYRTIWRWHFYAGLFVLPFVFILSVTGAIYLFKPQIDRWEERELSGLFQSQGQYRPISSWKRCAMPIPAAASTITACRNIPAMRRWCKWAHPAGRRSKYLCRRRAKCWEHSIRNSAFPGSWASSTDRC